MTASDNALPEAHEQSLDELLDAARTALGPDLVAVVLFGSGADGKLRATSDLNLMFVLARFDAARIDPLRERLRAAHALIRLECMLILESELHAAAESFAVKFADIALRHRLLWGRDVLGGLRPSRDASRLRLRQILLNFVLRTRERYTMLSLREEQLASVVADAAAPLRSAAALIFELEGRGAVPPKEALEKLAAEIDAARYATVLAQLSQAREQAALAPGAGRAAVLGLIDLGQALHARAEAL